MADEGMELARDDDAMAVSAAVNGPSAADVDNLRQEASVILREQGQLSLAELVLTVTITVVPRRRREYAMRLIIDAEVPGDGAVVGDWALLDEFRHSIRRDVRSLQEAGYDGHEISRVFPHIVLRAAQQAAGLVPPDDDDETTQPYPNGGFGAVPASAAAVRSLLEKQTSFFRAAAGGGGGGGGVAEGGCGVTECSICFDEFVDGAQVTVMPCPSHGHRFHPDCIAKWLGISNMCPLCRHELPWCV